MDLGVLLVELAVDLGVVLADLRMLVDVVVSLRLRVLSLAVLLPD